MYFLIISSEDFTKTKWVHHFKRYILKIYYIKQTFSFPIKGRKH